MNAFSRLSPLLSPESIAVVGASPSKGAGAIVLNNLQRIGFAGRIFPVNPKYSEIAGLPCYPSLEAIGEPVDSMALLLGDKSILTMLQTAHNYGVKAVWAFASGFAETGAEGEAAQRRIGEFCRETGMLFCGPNCVGVANIIDSAAMYSAPLPKEFCKGDIGVVAQSGAVLLALGNSSRKAGFSRLISSGNEAGLGLADYMNYLVDDPHTSVIALFVETLRDPEAVAAACARARVAKKPVIALKVGRSELACRVAATHTGALAGSDAVQDAFFRRHGILRVNTLDVLLETAMLFSTMKGASAGSCRVGMATVSGGEMGMLADLCADVGLEFPPLSKAGEARLREILPPYTPVANPLDAWGSGDLREAYPASLATLAAEPEVDLLLVSQDMPANMVDMQVDQFADVARAAVKVRQESGKPVVVISNISGGLDESLRRILDKGNVPVLQGSAQSLEAIRLWIRWHNEYSNKAVSIEPCMALPAALAAELDACDGVATYDLSVRLLKHFGLHTAHECLVITEDEAVTAAQALGYPVVLKVVSAQIPHKTETGLVHLNLANEAALRTACRKISNALMRHHEGVIIEGLLVQPMLCDTVETIVGLNRDPQFGAVVMAGLGGVFVELLQDVALSLAPITLQEAHAMIGSLRGVKLLHGFRGRPEADTEALADALVKLGRMAKTLGPRLVSLDCNPLMVLPRGRGVRLVDIVLQFSKNS